MGLGLNAPSALSVVVILMLDGWVSANHGDEWNADEQRHTPNLLPQEIGRKTPDKRNRP